MRMLSLVGTKFIFLMSCGKDEPLKANAEIIDFEPTKCGCCWGWLVKIGRDTIKIDSIPPDFSTGFEIVVPVPVYIKLGEREIDCSNSPDYYKIKTLIEVN